MDSFSGPEYRGISGYTVIKNSWRGKYKRLFSITCDSVTTLHPQTLEITNKWEYSEVAGLSHNFKSNKTEFMIIVPKSKGKSPSNMYFQTPYILEIMTDLFTQYKKFGCYAENMTKKFTGSKLHFDGKFSNILIHCGPASVDIYSHSTKKCIKKYFLKDVLSLHQVSDNQNMIVIKSRYSNKLHCFMVGEKSTLVQTIIDNAFKHLEITIEIGSAFTITNFLNSRLGDLDNENSLTVLSSFHVEKITKNSSIPLPRILGVSENAVIDHDPASYNVISIRSLSRIHSFYRCNENPRVFGIEWISGYPQISFYQSADRDSLITTFLDAVRLSGNSNAYVHSIRLHRHLHFNPLNTDVDEEVEVSCLKSVVNNIDKIEKIVVFNSNIPYTGFKHAHSPDYFFGDKKENVIQNAISHIFQIEKISSLSVTKIEEIFFALKRLFSTKAGFDSFISLKSYMKLGPLILMACKKNDAGVVYSAIETLNSLIIPFHPHSDKYFEQQNRISIFSDSSFIATLLSIFKENIINKTGALVISSMLDFINFSICAPFSETTLEEQYQIFIKLVQEIGYPLFRLFNHPSPSIVKLVGIIVKTLIDECDDEDVLKIQEMAFSEGIFPKHLSSSLFMSQSSSKKLNKCQLINRQLSRQLLAFWVNSNSLAKILLYRTIPHGLVNCLYSTQAIESDALELEIEREEIKMKVENKKEIDVALQFVYDETADLMKHWHAHIYKELTGTDIRIQNPQKTAQIRTQKPSKEVKENWNLFYHKFYTDCYTPDLIWNHKTREELHDALEVEIRALFCDHEIGGLKRICWNYDDFEVTYQSLKNEIRIGEYFLSPLLENSQFYLSRPQIFFSDLYNVFLQSQTREMKISCIKAMTKIYSQYYKDVKYFKDISYIYHLLTITESKYERDLYILLLKELVKDKDNFRCILNSKFVNFMIDLACLSHLHTSRALVPLQTLMIEGSGEEISNPDWFLNVSGKTDTPITMKNLKEKYDSQEINKETKIWTQGMEGWKPLKDISQLKWTLISSDSPIFDESALAVHVLEILFAGCVFFPNTDTYGSFVRPLPRISRFLAEVNSLPYLVQLLLTFDPPIINNVAKILSKIMIENPVLQKLFISGCYYFMLMYTGSNISNIAKFLKETHLCQAFLCDTKNQNNYISKSILSPLLPEALISYLENYDSVEFAKAFLGEYNTPEIIWSNNMRRHLVEKISVHLADFIPRLKSNVKSIYVFCPIPKIEYEELEGELFCGHYYLRHLCDTVKYPKWKIVDPIGSLRDILEAWKNEVNKKPSGMTLDDAYQTLELETGSVHDQSVVRRSYLKLVSKYHPDKNPDGAEVFDQIVNAYEFICNNMKKNQTPSVYNIILLIKSQIILFNNCYLELEPYKYPGYPLLISTILMELNDENLFSKNKEDFILLPAMQLAHATIACSALNAEELRRDNGINVLANVFDRCMNLITSKSEQTDPHILITEQVIKCFTASSRFEGFIESIIEIPQIFQNLNHILCLHENLLLLCCIIVEFITAMCAAEVVQLKIMKFGIVYHLINFLFLYDYSLFENAHELHDESNLQLKQNELANLSFQSLSIISVNSNREDRNQIKELFKKLLTNYIVEQFAEISSFDILKILNTNSETPYLIWNNNTRSQLKSLLDKIKKYSPETEDQNYELAINHSYEEDKTQLIVGTIYIYIFNKNPSFKLKKPLKIGQEFLIFLDNNIRYIFSAIKSNTEEKCTVKIQAIEDVLTALYNLYLQHSLGSLFKKNIILCLFSLFMLIQYRQVQKILIKIIYLLVSETECIATIAEAEVLGFLNISTRFLIEERQIYITIFQSLFSNNKIVQESIVKGTYLYLLAIFCEEKEIKTRIGIVELLARLISHKLYGPKINIIFNKFFPKLFSDAILDNPESAVLLYESTQENPELIWNEESRKMVSSSIRDIVDNLVKSQLDNPSHKFELPPNFGLSFTTGDGIIVCGVDIQRFIAQPSWVLRHPKDFLIGLFEKLIQELNNQDNTLIQTLTTAICLLLDFNPNLCDQLPTLGITQKLLFILDLDEPTKQRSAINILHVISSNKLCVTDFCKNDKWLNAVIKSFKQIPDYSNKAAELINKSFSLELSCMAFYVVKFNLISDIVSLLELPFSEIDSPSAARANIVNGLQALEKEGTYGTRVTEILGAIPSWKSYKFQKHDLFIEPGKKNLAIRQGSAGYSGYLMAAQNTSYTSADTTKMILNTEPPQPPDTSE